MLELYYKYPRVLRRLRSGGLGGEMDRIAAYLFEHGYKRGSAKVYLHRLGRFTDHVSCATSATLIDQVVIDRFVAEYPTEAPRISARTAIELARRVAPERFVRVDVVAGHPQPELAAPITPLTSPTAELDGQIEIVLSSGAKVRVDAQVN